MKYIVALVACILLFGGCHKVKRDRFAYRVDTLGSQWGVVDGSHITYYFQDADKWSDEISAYISDHEKGYETIDAVFKAQLPQKLRLYVWLDTALARLQLGYPAGFAIPSQCVSHLRPDQTIGHEMTHILCYWSGGIPPTVITRFVNEGVAVAFDLTNASRIDRAKSAVAGTGITSVLDVWYGGNSASEAVLYPVAGAFMEYLYKQNQPAKFDSLTKYQTVSYAQTIYGSGHFDQLVADFNKLLGL